MCFTLFWDEVFLGNLQFFLYRIACQFDDFHAVEQGRLDGVERIGCGNEHGAAEVVVHFHVIVVKRGILFRIQYLQQGRTRVSAEVASELVDFVQHKYRIRRACFLEVLYHPARHGADIGFAVAADFCFIVEAAEAHPYIFPSNRACYAASEACFTHTRRAVQTNNRTLQVVFKLDYGEVFKDALLHFFEAEMVFVEDFRSMGQIEVVGRKFIPGQIQQQLNIVQSDAVVGRSRIDAHQPVEFLVELLVYGF